MTRSVRASQTIKSNTLKKTAMQVAVVALMATAAAGCNRGIKPEVNDPVKLVQIAQPISVLQPVFSVNAGKNASKKRMAIQLSFHDGELVENVVWPREFRNSHLVWPIWRKP